MSKEKLDEQLELFPKDNKIDSIPNFEIIGKNNPRLDNWKTPKEGYEYIVTFIAQLKEIDFYLAKDIERTNLILAFI